MQQRPQPRAGKVAAIELGVVFVEPGDAAQHGLHFAGELPLGNLLPHTDINGVTVAARNFRKLSGPGITGSTMCPFVIII